MSVKLYSAGSLKFFNSTFLKQFCLFFFMQVLRIHKSKYNYKIAALYKEQLGTTLRILVSPALA